MMQLLAFRTSPFEAGLEISPLNSLPKKDTAKRRIILDLSFPINDSVNTYISKDEYLGEITNLVYLVDDFIQLIITETSPYSFGNFRKLLLYNCFMPI